MTEVPPTSGAAAFEESPYVTIKRLERALGLERRFSAKATRQLHRTMLREVRQADKRARVAEQAQREAERGLVEAGRRTAAARARAEAAEKELAAVRQSTTWKAGRAVLVVPTQVRQRWRRR